MPKAELNKFAQVARPMRPAQWWFALLVPGALWLASAPARAEDFEPPPINDENPSASLPSREDRMKSPLLFGYVLMTLTERGESALKEGDGPRAARYFEAVTQAVPERAIGFSKLCEAYGQSGDKARAELACHEALFKDGVTLADYARYLQIRRSHPAPWKETDWAEVDAVLAHYRQSTAPSPEIDRLACELALRDVSGARLGKCVSELKAGESKDAKLLLLAWADATRRGRSAEAERLLASAKAAGLTPEQLKQVEHLGSPPGVTSVAERLFRFGTVFLGIAGLVLVGLGVGKLLKRSRPAPSGAPEAVEAQ